MAPSAIIEGKSDIVGMDNGNGISRICCIGAGYVGGTTSAVIAQKCPHIQVTVVDRNLERIQSWNSEELPVSEPDLLKTVKVARDGVRSNGHGNLHFTSQVETSISQADLIIISVDTPTKTRGAGSGDTLDISSLESVALSIAKFARSDKIVVEKSTVPVGTGEILRNILMANSNPGVQFEVLSNPEFLAEGSAIQNLAEPDRVLIGSLQTTSALCAATSLADIYANWVPRSRIITTNLWSSELSKLAANALLAQRISSINALSAICEATGASITEVSRVVGSDSRIGPHMLKPSIGFGGSCFKKDVKCLVYLCKSLNLHTIASYWASILEINNLQKSRSLERVVSGLHNNLYRKTVAVLGFAFKKHTADTRESCAIDLVRGLLDEGAFVNIYDPWVPESKIRTDIESDGYSMSNSLGGIQVFNSGEEACHGAQAVLIATDWDNFRVRSKVYLSPSTTMKEQENDSIVETLPECGELPANGQPKPHLQNGHSQITSDLTTNNGCHQSESEAFLDWSHISNVMLYPKLVFGSNECLDGPILKNLGFDVKIIGNLVN